MLLENSILIHSEEDDDGYDPNLSEKGSNCDMEDSVFMN